jgi:hypothetical protein
LKECGPCRVYASLPGICLTTEEKAQKYLSQGKKNLAMERSLLASFYIPKYSVVLPAFQVQVLIWTSDLGSNPERAHGDKFLVCQLSKFATQQEV